MQVRNVPTELRDALEQDARSRGQSLQAYLREVLERQGMIARNRAILRDFEPIRGTSADESLDVVELIAESRAERERQILDAIGDSST